MRTEQQPLGVLEYRVSSMKAYWVINILVYSEMMSGKMKKQSWTAENGYFGAEYSSFMPTVIFYLMCAQKHAISSNALLWFNRCISMCNYSNGRLVHELELTWCENNWIRRIPNQVGINSLKFQIKTSPLVLELYARNSY